MNLEKLSPAFQDYLWGGTKLRDLYGKHCDLGKVAESWELSTHPAGESKIQGGRYDGLTLGQYLQQVGKAALGRNAAAFENFPVLIKLIDAKEALSIQVHPSDAYALQVEHEYGKTEMWVVIDCDPGATLYFGVNRPVSREEFQRRVQEGTVTQVLDQVEIRPGDVFFIQAGTIHAIGAGILICEIQQNSNCTYRVYDYGRLGADGKPRELHIQKALDVCRLTPEEGVRSTGPVYPLAGGTAQDLGACAYFAAQRLQVERALTLEVGEDSFVSLLATQGSGVVCGPENSLAFGPGDSLFLPAGAGKVRIAGEATLIKTTVPQRAEDAPETL